VGAVIIVFGESFPVLWSGRVAVVRLPPEVDLTTADALREALLSVLNQGAHALIADMTATTFCDSAGITALVRAVRRATATGATVPIPARAPNTVAKRRTAGTSAWRNVFSASGGAEISTRPLLERQSHIRVSIGLSPPRTEMPAAAAAR
jgi:anti-anti-sigma factor